MGGVYQSPWGKLVPGGRSPKKKQLPIGRPGGAVWGRPDASAAKKKGEVSLGRFASKAYDTGSQRAGRTGEKHYYGGGNAKWTRRCLIKKRAGGIDVKVALGTTERKYKIRKGEMEAQRKRVEAGNQCGIKGGLREEKRKHLKRKVALTRGRQGCKNSCGGYRKKRGKRGDLLREVRTSEESIKRQLVKGKELLAEQRIGERLITKKSLVVKRQRGEKKKAGENWGADFYPRCEESPWFRGKTVAQPTGDRKGKKKLKETRFNP